MNTVWENEDFVPGADFDPEVTLLKRPQEETVFSDVIAIEFNNAMEDALRAAWNGWDAAVRLQTPELEDYYMRMINLLGATKAKLRKLVKTK